MDIDLFHALVNQAALAPSVHNIQPARFRLAGDRIEIAADLAVTLPASDPTGRDVGLSCGAAAEALVIALSTRGFAAEVADHWLADDRTAWPGHRLAASLRWRRGGAPDPLAPELPRRFTHRGGFLPDRPGDFSPADALILDPAALADLQDDAIGRVLADDGQRGELLRWMRLSPRHPRYDFDGLALPALRMSQPLGLMAGLALDQLWPLIRVLRLARVVGAEAASTRAATCVALLHRPVGESPATSGRALLRLWLAATARGWAGWPMAALTDDPAARAALLASHPLPPGRAPILALRFGPADAPPPPRARRPQRELIG